MIDPHSLPVDQKISQLIDFALTEDLGDGDHSSLSTIDAAKTGVGRVRFKQDGIISGIDIAEIVVRKVDDKISIKTFAKSGDAVKNGDVVMELSGNVRNLLRAERILLNFMQRMSGIATMTRKFVDAVAGTKTIIIDTRKTTPNFRWFEKRAVVDGGGQNHRFGLYDMIMIKDNHVDEAGGITKALNKVNEYQKSKGKKLKVEIETRNLGEVKEAVETKLADRIMLDNFSPENIQEAVNYIAGRAETEASGGITLDNVKAYALSGVDFISVGALTHSYKSLDISMKISDS
jgi:nicotinate-nucleotide pyrophosphorylase (carboxylating)